MSFYDTANVAGINEMNNRDDIIKCYTQLQTDYKVLQGRYEMLLRTQIAGMDDSSGIGDMLRRTEALEKQVKDLQEKNHTLEVALDAKESYISHINQIIRERSCSPRGIPNKRKATGYIVTGLTQQIERTGGDYSQEGVCWRLTIQTYYDRQYRFSTVKEQLITDIQETLLPLLFEKEVRNYLNSSTEQVISLAAGNQPFVALYRIKAKLDIRTGFWEIELYFTEEPYIPEGLLAKNKSEKKEQAINNEE